MELYAAIELFAMMRKYGVCLVVMSGYFGLCKPTIRVDVVG